MTRNLDDAVLDVLKTYGRMLLSEIYEKMENHPLVTSHHKEDWGGQPKLSLEVVRGREGVDEDIDGVVRDRVGSQTLAVVERRVQRLSPERSRDRAEGDAV